MENIKGIVIDCDLLSSRDKNSIITMYVDKKGLELFQKLLFGELHDYKVSIEKIESVDVIIDASVTKYPDFIDTYPNANNLYNKEQDESYRER